MFFLFFFFGTKKFCAVVKVFQLVLLLAAAVLFLRLPLRFLQLLVVVFWHFVLFHLLSCQIFTFADCLMSEKKQYKKISCNKKKENAMAKKLLVFGMHFVTRLKYSHVCNLLEVL